MIISEIVIEANGKTSIEICIGKKNWNWIRACRK